tara:strand:- start:10 stop:204 length:195 start_codon:yes stop_codon:yes gene_type:complete
MSGLLAASGAGRPPQRDENDLIVPPCVQKQKNRKTKNQKRLQQRQKQNWLEIEKIKIKDRKIGR